MAMSDEHKTALAQGRVQARAIKKYLGAIGTRKRGRPVTRDTLTARIQRLDGQIATEQNPLKALDLRQGRLDTQQQLTRLEHAVDINALEKEFVAHAAAYSERKGISYAAWREAGVPAAALQKAGVRRTG